MSIRIAIKKREIFIFGAIFLYCAALFLKRTSISLNQIILNKIMTIATIMALVNIFIDAKMTLKQWTLFGITGILLFLDSLPTGNHEILYLFIIIWGCRNVDKEIMMKFIFDIVMILTLIIAICVIFGLVENKQFVLNGIRERKGLGYSVWSILPFQFFSLCILYIYFHKKKVRLYKVILINIAAIYIGIVTDTKTSIIATVFCTLVIYGMQNIHIKSWKRLRWMMILPEMLAAVSFLITYFFTKGNFFLEKINLLLNHRFMYQSFGLNRYGISLFANPNVEISMIEGNYFGIDNQYMNLLITWGVAALIIVLLIYSYLISYCIKYKNIKLLVIVLSMLMIAMIWSRLIVLIEAEYLVCFGEVFANKRIRNRESMKNPYGDGMSEKSTYIC